MEALQVPVLALQVPAAWMLLLLGDLEQLPVQRMLVAAVVQLVVERHNLPDPGGLPSLLGCACQMLAYPLLNLEHDSWMPQVAKPH